MWIPSKFIDALEEYVLSNIIDEIIIIDNNPSNKLNIPKNNHKIKILTKNKNIFVNPSWNWGVSESKNENILLINDDLIIKNIDNILEKILETDYDLIGLDFNNLNTNKGIIIKDHRGGMTKGFGCFMFIKKSKYTPIPDELKIWYGDKILFDKSDKKGIIHFDNVEIFLSKTIKSVPGSIEVINQDTINYKNYNS